MTISYQRTAMIPQARLAHLKCIHTRISNDVIFYIMEQTRSIRALSFLLTYSLHNSSGIPNNRWGGGVGKFLEN